MMGSSDCDQQMSRCVEHCSNLHSRETIVTDNALSSTADLPVMEQCDSIPTIEELSKAIDSKQGGKAPGNNGIPSEVMKRGKPALLKTLHQLLCLCREEDAVPEYMHDTTIITQKKNMILNVIAATVTITDAFPL